MTNADRLRMKTDEELPNWIELLVWIVEISGALYFDVITKEDKSDIEKIIVRAVERWNKEPEEEQ